jgi:deoxyribodipyrimidine photo-lyase
MRLQVVWFRRDLRLGDHPALHQAASEGAVLPLFILDPALLQHPETGVARVGVLLDNLAALDHDLRQRSSRLLVRWGEPAASLLSVVKAYRADAVLAHVDSERIVGRVRDARVHRQLQQAGVPLRWIEPPGGLEELVPYRAYRRFWHGVMAAEPLPAPGRLRTPAAVGGECLPAIPTLEELGMVDDGKPRPPGGSAAALRRLQAFCRQEVSSRYYWQLSYPAARASSGISPYLKFGVLTHRQCLHAIAPLRRGDGGRQRSWRQLVSRLRWGAGMAQRFRYLPQLELEPLWRCHRDHAGLSGDQEEMYLRWQQGGTGFPIVDAVSRCLLATGGWRDLNFRSRAIHASFLTNLCGIDWRYGALHYMRHLLDGDCPIDHYQWAMQAGVTAGGTGAWTRIYHPGQVAVDRCDPHGVFIRRWLPELAELTNDQLGLPPAMEAYPPPMLDYETARRERLRSLEARRQGWSRGSFSPMPDDLTPFGAERFSGAETAWCQGSSQGRSLLPVPLDLASLDATAVRALESWFVMGRPNASTSSTGRSRHGDRADRQLSLFGPD